MIEAKNGKAALLQRRYELLYLLRPAVPSMHEHDGWVAPNVAPTVSRNHSIRCLQALSFRFSRLEFRPMWRWPFGDKEAARYKLCGADWSNLRADANSQSQDRKPERPIGRF